MIKASKTATKPRTKPKPVIPAKFDKKPEQPPAPKLEIVKVSPQEELALRQNYSDEEIRLMKDTVAKGTTDIEFAFFLYVAKRRRLDPLLRQLHCVKRKSKMRDESGDLVKINGEQQYEEVMTIQTGIDGYRVVADRTTRYAPSDKRPLYENQGTPDFCCTVWVKKWSHGEWHEVPGTAYYSEYVQTYVKWEKSQPIYKPNAMWNKMPRNQLAKCAEALALRKAFPEAMSGLYIHEEMEHLDSTEDAPRKETGSVPAKLAEPSKVITTQVQESKESTPEQAKPQDAIKESAEPNRGHGNEGTQTEQRGPTRPQLKDMLEATLVTLWPDAKAGRKYRAVVGKTLFNAEVKADIERLPIDKLGIGVFALSIFQARIQGGLEMPIGEEALTNELFNAMEDAKREMQAQKEAQV